MTYTFGWSAFMLPAQIVGGGVSGLSAILYYAVGIHIPIGILNLVFNGILVAIGFKMLGSKFGANTIYGIAMSSVFFIMWQQGLHVENLFMNPDGSMQFDPFMCAIIGGALCGLGIGLSFIMGGNTGGTDIIALIVTKYYNISPGRVIMLLDIVIVGCSYFVSGKLGNVIYGYVVMGPMCLTWCSTATSRVIRLWSFRLRTRKLARLSPAKWAEVPPSSMQRGAIPNRTRRSS